MNELNTWLGKEIPLTTRGILYLCYYDHKNKTIIVGREILFDSSFDASNTYANIHNPESQLMTGKDFDSLIKEVHALHKKLQDPQWVADLSNYL